MNLQVNQNRQFFAFNDYTTNPAKINKPYVGKFFPIDGVPEIYFMMMGMDNEIRRSDLIPIPNILSARASNPKITLIQSTLITLQSNATPIPGKTYVMNISLDNFCNAGAENTYLKHGTIVATSDMASATKKFYFALAKSIATNFYREMNPFVKVYLTSGSNNATISNEVKYNSTETEFNVSSTTYTGILLVGQDIDKHIQGIVEHTVPTFTVSGNLIDYRDSDGNLLVQEWIDVTNRADMHADLKSALSSVEITITNTDEVSDIEYFCMGERADQYRTLGNVPVNPTRYSVPALTETAKAGNSGADPGWCLLDIHYFYSGDNESVQKSEKTLTIAIPSDDGSTNYEFSNMLSEFNELTGLNVVAQ